MLNIQAYRPSLASSLPELNSNTINLAKPNEILKYDGLDKDTVNFSGRKTKAVVDLTYNNILDKTLKSEPNPNFQKELSEFSGIKSLSKATQRVASLSRYLKEDMIGFIVPEYTLEGQKKGGYQWFEKSLEYLLRGSENCVKPSEYTSVAKGLFGLLATHDKYWKSDEFISYLSSLKQNDAIKATIKAVKQLQNPKEVSFTGKQLVEMYGSFSPLKAMSKLLNDGCAYSGVKLKFDNPSKNNHKISPRENASLEHIMPKSWDGPCDDANYLVASQESNSLRGNMPLIQYLKGYDDSDN